MAQENPSRYEAQALQQEFITPIEAEDEGFDEVQFMC